MQKGLREKRQRIFCLLVTLFVSGSLLSQQPHHFFLGAEELSGLDIYGLNQDFEGNYWITSDKGLTKYDGYTFKQYENNKQLNSSLFNPTLNYKGELFCNNLSGQIFKVQNDSLVLFHTVPDSLLSAYVNFNFLPNDEMIVSSTFCYRVKGDKLVVLGSNMIEYGQASFFRQKDGSLLINNTYTTIARITNSNFTEIQTDAKSNDRFLFKFLVKDQSLFGLDRSGEIYLIDTVSDQRLSIKKIGDKQGTYSRIYGTSKNIWIALDKFGVYRMPYPSGSFLLEENKMLFKNHFISYVFEDRDGNILLGTFNDGILVIPKTNMENVQIPSGVNISQIASDQIEGVFYGTVQGSIYHWTEDGIKTLKNQGARIVETLEYYSESNHLFYDDFLLYLHNTETQKISNIHAAAIKDIVEMRKGVYAFGNFGTTRIIQVTNGGVNISHIFKTGRVNQLVYNSKTKHLFVHTSKGLIKIDSLGILNPLFDEKKGMQISDMEQDDSVTFIATRKQGLLKLVNEEISPFLDTNTGLINNDIRRIEVHNKRLFVSTEKGFQIFSIEGSLIKTISATDGLASNKIIDFAVDDQFIWFLTQFGLQRYHLNSQAVATSVPEIKHIKVFRNGVPLDDKPYALSNDTYLVMFRIFAPSLTLQNDMKYLYQLNENPNWTENEYHDNEIRFSSLAPGKYTLRVQLLHKGDPVDEQKITFSIAPPFWETWWFYSILLIVSVFTFYISLRYRLKQQEKRNQELFELSSSKLTALQAQMNPHFIFNALNSIQEYIMHNDRKIAGKYLGKFADLMRMYLDNSRKQSISLSEELEALNLYLQLEELRFENTLTFDIAIEKEANLDVQIPSMFIQPYVENAIKHGLLHRTSDRKLSISVRKSVDSNEMICEIEDNGVGRIKSREINKLRAQYHKPFATSANTRRLELLNLHRQYPIIEEIEDLYGENGEGSGTMIRITIPLDEN